MPILSSHLQRLTYTTNHSASNGKVTRTRYHNPYKMAVKIHDEPLSKLIWVIVSSIGTHKGEQQLIEGQALTTDPDLIFTFPQLF